MQLINDLSVKLKRYESEISRCVDRVIQSGWLVLGPEVERFEQSFAEYHSREFCVGLANGTDALELALRALGIQTDSTVATVANAGAYTMTAINSIGASAHFLEVEQHSQCVSLDSVKLALEHGVDAVVVTHLFGRIVPEIEQIVALCAQHGTPVLEDCAQAHGASLAGKFAGCFGDVASFSFYPTKNLGALGDGGAVLTNSQVYANKVMQLRQYGWSDKYQIAIEGGRNSRLDAIQAALLNEFLPHLGLWNEERISIATRYDNGITNPRVSKPPIDIDNNNKPYVAHLYVVQTDSRDELRSHLKRHEILTDIHYPLPDHKQMINLNTSADVSLPVTESLAQKVLTLPCYPGMSDAQVEHVIEAVNSCPE